MDRQLNEALARIGLLSFASASVTRVVAEPIGITPLDAARRLSGHGRIALLDSSLPTGGAGSTGRWSYLGADPFLIVQARGRRVELRAGGGCTGIEADPFELVAQLLRRLHISEQRGLPPFVGGGIGYFGYDLGRLLERLPDRLPAEPALPDLDLAFFDQVLAWDHMEERGWVIGLEWEGKRLGRGDLRTLPTKRHAARTDREGSVEFRSNVSREAYLASVRRVLGEIAAGEVYQVNVSQRLEGEWLGTAWEAYERLRDASPVPFGAFLQLDHDRAILSASPERFLRLDGRRVETRPMKGTRPRGATPEEDASLAAELANSPKDRAENAMIVDVLRNDLGRVCRTGSVTVEELCAVEAYSTVWQLVSVVSGELQPGLTAIDLLRACFPGGSITGAPKIRAMELIEEIETVRRGVYCGAIGYQSASGAMDSSIAIRTVVLDGQRLLLSVGGGIVADSDPQNEYEESLVKARAALAAFGGRLA